MGAVRGRALRVGVVSDTHGLLRPEAVAFLGGADCIVHAGDIGHADVLRRLAALAPVTAERVYVLHDLAELDLDPAAAGFRVVVSGHSHRPRMEERAGVLYLNPGSAGPRRFKLPVAAAELAVEGAKVRARLVTLDIGT